MNINDTDVLLSEEFEESGPSVLQIGRKVKYDIGYGDLVECIIVAILTLPVPNDPKNPNRDNGFRYTFHVAIQSKNPDLNKLRYNNIPIYKICPVTDPDLIVSLDDSAELPKIPDSVLTPEDFEGWD